MTARVRGLTVLAPDGTPVLDRVDLELPAGLVTAVVGESGAGKTTLAHALVGHLGSGLRRTAGSVVVAGHDPFSADGRRAVRGRLAGLVPQDPASALDPQRRVGAQLRTAVRVARPRDPRARRLADVQDAVRSAALEPELLGRRPTQLSGGQAQRTLLAWALVTRPALLVLDEPTSGLDAATARDVAAAFTSLPWRPAVLVISHDDDLVARTADRTASMVAGRLGADGPRPGTRVRERARPSAPRHHDVDRAALVATGVTVRRGGRTILDGVDLSVGAGELVAVQGRSGSGKTSLARAVCGLVPPTAGELRVLGRVTPWDAGARARGGAPYVAYVGQDARAALHPQETVRRAVARARASAERLRRPRWGEAELLSRLRLPSDVLDRTPDRLSGGQRHRVALACALAADPAVLVCDETTAALDGATARLVLDALDDVRAATALPIVLVTHQDAVAARADRVLALRDGRL
ncbi:ABC transporter ATP-binding protein [Cellulomonas phragmiteti]|uniref:ABC transporter ATP-binding protein n=1 Tax=Cellulomonas phragmiteti TaxID=478780 RepID=A0ABQ4DNN5_9CELL|nr:ATP-binding cassette domain-containing protein [Cellulomonas phragmiteti]GIG40597.1 ABC transporter ATP-binding protein [Cellulomonas phragmiteti]